MGDDYKYKELAGIPYIEYRSYDSGWNDRALKLTHDQFEKITGYFCKEDDARKAFLRSIVDEVKNDS